MGNSSTHVRRLLESIFNIREEEYRKVLLMFLYSLFTIAGGFIIGRTVASTLFLNRINPSYLPFTYIGAALFISVVSMTYSKIANRLRRDRTIIVSLAIFTIFSLLFRAGLFIGPKSLLLMGGIFVFIEVMGAISIIQFWTFANDIFTSREAKRLFALIGAGGTLASIVFGFLIRFTVESIGAPNLLYAIALLQFMCIFIIIMLGRLFSDQLDKQHNRISNRGENADRVNLFEDVQRLVRSKHLLNIALIMVIMTVVVIIVDYQFLMVARANHMNNENALAGFFGTFYLYAGVISFFFQFFITGRILQRFGILFALLFLPITLLILSAGIIFFSTQHLMLWFIAGAKGSDNIIRYSINNPTLQLLHLPVDPDFRPRAKALIEGVIKPISTGLSGLFILIFVVIFSYKQLSLAMVILIIGWIALTLQARKHYMAALAETIRKKKLDLSERTLPVDDNTIRVLTASLTSGNDRDAFNALELLPAVPGRDWDPLVTPLLSSARPGLVQKALEYLGRKGNFNFGDAVSSAFHNQDPEVRASAIAAYSAIYGEEKINTIAGFINDPDPCIKAASVAALIQHGGLDGILSAANEFKSMLEHSDPEMRLAGAGVLGIINVKQFYKPLLALLDDKDIRVQIQAIKAAGIIKNQELVKPLIQKLGSNAMAWSASRALAGYGENLFPYLERYMEENRKDREIMLRIPGIMREVGTQKCMDILLKKIDSQDPDFLFHLYRSIRGLQKSHPGLAIDRRTIADALEKEIKCYYEQLRFFTDLSGQINSRLLIEALSRQIKKTESRVMSLISIMFPSHSIEHISAGLRSPDTSTRSNAIELLDNILTGDFKKPLLAMFEDLSRERKIRIGRLHCGKLKSKTAKERISELLESPDKWIMVTTIHEIGESGRKEFAGNVKQVLNSSDFLIRETALHAFESLLNASEFRDILKSLANDSCPRIREFARSYEMSIILEES
ncbi:MAG: Npt1/Npt2 family nucleotide transporter [Desulfobacterales bacterium]